MIAIVKTLSNKITKGYRQIKALCFGKSDARECYEAVPFGIDSSPLKDMDAIYATTSINALPVIIGYLNKKQLADTGEMRIFATDAGGSVKFNIWQRNDGTCLIGTSIMPADYIDNLVRYEKLNLALQNQVSLINTQLTAISTGLAGVGGIYTPAPIALDISASKITEIKTE